MFHRTLHVLGGVVCAVVIAHASPACALGWSAPVDGCTIITAYGAEYGGHTHGGVDLAGDTGDAISSPVAGTVIFAGSVPADGGGTCKAVTIELSSGDKVSLLPLSEAWVSEGEHVEASEQVGSLACAGDDSTEVVHLHLSLRHDGAYIDPTSLLPSSASPVAALPTAPKQSIDPPQAGSKVGSAAGVMQSAQQAAKPHAVESASATENSDALGGPVTRAAATSVSSPVDKMTSTVPYSQETLAGESVISGDSEVSHQLIQDAGAPIPSSLMAPEPARHTADAHQNSMSAGDSKALGSVSIAALAVVCSLAGMRMSGVRLPHVRAHA